MELLEFGKMHDGMCPGVALRPGMGGWEGCCDVRQDAGRCETNGNQMLLSTKAASWDLDRAPTLVASTLPFLKIIRVGMPRMPNLGGVA